MIKCIIFSWSKLVTFVNLLVLPIMYIYYTPLGPGTLKLLLTYVLNVYIIFILCI